MVHGLFSDIGLDTKKAKIENCFRLPARQDQSGPPALKILFSREGDKRNFFAALPHMKKSTKAAKIGFNDEIPAYLKDQNKMLSEKLS